MNGTESTTKAERNVKGMARGKFSISPMLGLWLTDTKACLEVSKAFSIMTLRMISLIVILALNTVGSIATFSILSC